MNYKRRNLKRSCSTEYQSLEPKRLLATISIQDVAGRETLVIDGDSSRNVAIVTDLNTTQVRVTADGQALNFNKADFERIRFLGRSGDDFFNNLTDIPSAAFGHNGNDTLIGGNGNNWIQGGGGNDRLIGGDSNDNLRGRAGNDFIDGGRRHDRIFGGDGNDELIGRGGNDLIQGEAGNDFIFGLNGNDRIEGGAGDDRINNGQGDDQTLFDTAYSNFSVAGENSVFVTDRNGAGGKDRIFQPDVLRFSDQALNAFDALNAEQRVIVRPIIVSNNAGGNTAESFGNQEQEDDIKDLVDGIFAQADIDVLWQNERAWNNSFANVGNSNPRPTSDLNTIVSNGDDGGIGSPDTRVIDLYFVEVVPGFNDLGENFANGLAFVGNTGVAVHVGDNLVSFTGGRELVSRVIAHEIAHNLGLEHIDSSTNLLDENATGTNLTAAQISQMLASNLSQDI